ncbi:hypothetical protein BXZ70DRAFT_947572 [Cristinia sonorae]|uniref:MYND-type domain-containing protein n=1 Tax=Cristinia sonorae TaxID=1940300 RepID=A0A8K0UIW8_9AGAR|nr:hypothetical protein BXZ70DRAFT_947572 [Cristinia sonorae]
MACSFLKALIDRGLPRTRYGRLDGDRNVILTSVDWLKVVTKEHEYVGDWIYHLHRKRHPIVEHLLHVMLTTICAAAASGSISQSRWRPYDAAHLPCVLMDILCEPDLFDDVGKPEYLIVIVDLHLLLANFVDVVSAVSNQASCGQHLAERLGDLSKVLWIRRHLIIKNANLPPSDLMHLPYERCLVSCMDMICMLSQRLRASPGEKRPPESLFTFAVHFMLYVFAFSEVRGSFLSDYSIISMALEGILGDLIGFPKLTSTLFERHPDGDLGPALCQKLCRCMRDENLPGDDAIRLMGFIGVLVEQTAPQLWKSQGSASEERLLFSIFICWRRQLCMSQETLARNFSKITTKVLMKISGNSSVRPMFCVDMVVYSKQASIIAMLSHALVATLEDGAWEDALSALALMDLQNMLPKHFIINPEEHFANLRRENRRIWHDTWNKIKGVHVRTEMQHSMKLKIIQLWLEQGRRFDLREGKDVTTLIKPSALSEERRYWKIPKRCFWGPCACSAYDHPPHHLRTCKGCWRVLYCSSKCQAADWAAGHKNLCQGFS